MNKTDAKPDCAPLPKNGEVRPPSSYVSASAPSHDPRIAHVIAEMVERRTRGELPRAEDYFSRYPEIARNPDLAIDLIYEEVCLRQDAGEKVEEEELYNRFPHWRTELQVLLSCDRMLTSAAPAPQYPAVGETLSGYRVLSELGRGTQGRVYLAMQLDLADRPMVLKMTPPDGREHVSLARLQHTHIVPLYAVHEEPARNLRLICMPYLGGMTLSRLLEIIPDKSSNPGTGRHILAALDTENSKQSPPVGGGELLPGRCPARLLLNSLSYVQAICWIGASLADALDYAHERGLVHLDLKPSNVLLAADGQPMLLDFHLAQPPLHPSQPAPDRLGGTTAYMSPEQRLAMKAVSQGRSVPQPVDRRSDVYSLGVMLYEALGGPRPAGNSSSPAVPATDRHREFSSSAWTIGIEPAPAVNGVYPSTSLTQLQPLSLGTIPEGAHGQAKQNPPAFAPLQRCNPQVPLELSDLIHKCLADNPASRYATAAALGADLRRHVKSEPLQEVRTRSVRERWGKWRRRKPYVLAFIGMLSLLLVSAIAVGLNSWASVRRQTNEIRNALAQGKEERQSGGYRAAIATLERGVNLASSLPWAEELRQQLIEELSRAQNDEKSRLQNQSIADLHRQADQIRLEASFEDLSRSRLTELLAACRAWWQRRDKVLDRSARVDQPLLEQARFDLADLAIIGAEIQVRLGKGGDESAARREAMAWLTDAESLTGPSSVLLWILRKLEQPEAETPPPVARTPWEHYTVGRFFLQQRKLEDALRSFQQSVVLQPRGIWPNFCLGICAYRLGQWEDAVAAFSVCAALLPENAVCLYNRGLAYAALNRVDRAVGDYNAALERDPRFAAASLNRGILHFKEQRFGDAIADLERALRDGANPAIVHYNLALVFREQGDDARALASVQRALQSDAHFADAKALADQLQKR